MSPESSADHLKKELSEIYTPLEAVEDELRKRWNNSLLKQSVDALWEGDIPDVLNKSPRAIISRHVMSPNFELLNFLKSVKKTSLEPLGLEYLEDKFVTKNEDKYYLGKMFFYHGLGKKGGIKTISTKVIDFDRCDGKKISDINTIHEQNFVEFHHRLVSSVLDENHRLDMSAFYKRQGKLASNYYDYVLSLFIAHGVLFENFLASGFYAELTRDIFLPRFRYISDKFGVKPLIVRLVPEETEEDIYWRQYPEEYESAVSAIMNEKIQYGHI